MDDLVLDLPTGALIAGDAATVFGDARPLVTGLPCGSYPIAAVDDGVAIRLSENAPASWTELAPIRVPSGYLALLDRTALAEYTDLGDEPVDEFELLTAQLADEPVADFGGVLAARVGSGGVASLALGRDSEGVVCQILLRLTREALPS